MLVCSQTNIIRVATVREKSGKKQKFFKVREKSGNDLKIRLKSLILSKSVKSQEILFSGLEFISFFSKF